MSRFCLVILALCFVNVAGPLPADSESPGRQTLDVWTQKPNDPNPNERAFLQALQTVPGFRDALEQRFQIRFYAIADQPGFARRWDIQCGPTFVVGGRPIVRGFRGADVLLAELGLPALPIASAEIDLDGLRWSLAQELNAALQTTCDDFTADLRREQLQRFESLTSTLDHHTARLDRLEAGAPDFDGMKRFVLQLDSRVKFVEHSIADRPVVPAEKGPDNVTPPAPDAVDPPGDTAHSPPRPQARPALLTRVFHRTLTIAEWVALIGIGGGSAGGASLALWALKRWIGSKTNRAAGTSQRGDTGSERDPPSPANAGGSIVVKDAALKRQNDELRRQVKDLQAQISKCDQYWSSSQEHLFEEQDRTRQLTEKNANLERRIQELTDRLRSQPVQLVDCPDCATLREANEQLAAERRQLRLEIQTLKATHRGTETKFVQVPVTNREAEALKDAMRRECNINKKAVPIVARIQSVAQELLHGMEIVEKRRVDDDGEHQALNES